MGALIKRDTAMGFDKNTRHFEARFMEGIFRQADFGEPEMENLSKTFLSRFAEAKWFILLTPRIISSPFNFSEVFGVPEIEKLRSPESIH